MSEFEKWFMDQEFYTNMRFIHGDALFNKDGDVYRVLPVQMTHVAWVRRSKPILGKLFNFDLLDSLKAEVVKLKAGKEKLELELSQTKQVLHNVIDIERSKVEKLKVEKAELEKSVKQILSDSKESMVGYVEMDLYDKGYRVCTEYLIDELEKALRGEHE